MNKAILENKNKEQFELDNKEIDNILSAEFIVQVPFKEFDGTPEEYIKKVRDELGEPKFPEIGKEGIVLGWLLFNGIREFGIEYLRRILKEDDAIDSIIYMLVAQSEALSPNIAEGDFETSEDKIEKEGN